MEFPETMKGEEEEDVLLFTIRLTAALGQRAPLEVQMFREVKEERVRSI
jgi:hypothetical protein